MKINQPSEYTFQQTFAVFWRYNDIKYSASLHLGFSISNWYHFTSGVYEGRKPLTKEINGSYDLDTGIITFIVPKDHIGNPEKNDVLTHTWSNAFRRLGFIGRIGFTRYILDAIILQFFGNNMWDYAPARGNYGESYIVQY